jgi:hypothetical protein
MWRRIYPSEASPQIGVQLRLARGSVNWPALRAGGPDIPDIIEGCSWGTYIELTEGLDNVQ